MKGSLGIRQSESIWNIRVKLRSKPTSKQIRNGEKPLRARKILIPPSTQKLSQNPPADNRVRNYLKLKEKQVSAAKRNLRDKALHKIDSGKIGIKHSF